MQAIEGPEREERRSEKGCELQSEESGVPAVEVRANALPTSAREAGANPSDVDVASVDEDDTQLAAIRELMTRAAARGVWLTLEEIAQATEFAEASISAQLRHLRKPHNGGHRVEKRRRAARRSAAVRREVRNRRRGPVIWEYHVL
jgi:hypothetical protein